MSTPIPSSNSENPLSAIEKLKKVMALLQSYLTNKPVITGTVLTSVGEVAGESVAETHSIIPDHSRVIVKDPIRVYPLGMKTPPLNYLLRNEITGESVTLSRKDFNILFIER